MKNNFKMIQGNSKKLSKIVALTAALGLTVSLMACAAPSAATQVTTKPSASASQTTVASSTAGTTTSTTVAAEKTFTVDELAKYDGQNGNPAYIAVDGVVYDVSAISAWRNGIHQGQYKAGMDYTDLIKKSPHGTKVLDQAVKVGVMA